MTAVAVDQDERTWSATEVATMLGATHRFVHYWANRWLGHRPGSGNWTRLDRADVLTLYAFTQIDETPHRRLIADAIRSRPAPVVAILGPDRAVTVDTWEAAVHLAFDLGRGHLRRCVDLTPAWDWTAA